jgi:hypothetical protein
MLKNVFFLFVNVAPDKEAKVIAPGQHFQPSLIFDSMARALPLAPL